jgi:hypothetical protein
MTPPPYPPITALASIAGDDALAAAIVTHNLAPPAPLSELHKTVEL